MNKELETDLRASVVNIFSSNFNTETQRFSRRHREKPFPTDSSEEEKNWGQAFDSSILRFERIATWLNWLGRLGENTIRGMIENRRIEGLTPACARRALAARKADMLSPKT